MTIENFNANNCSDLTDDLQPVCTKYHKNTNDIVVEYDKKQKKWIDS